MNQPCIQPIAGKDLWRLTADYEVFTGAWYVRAMAGLITDGASIPDLPILRWVIGDAVEDDLAGPAVIHDALYQAESLPRNVCDQILYDLCRQNGVGRCRAWLIYRAVRMFGGCVWARHDTQQVLNAQAQVEVKSVCNSTPSARPQS